MDLNDAREFIRANRRGVLATRRPDGAIRQSPIIATVEGEGRVVISSRETAYKVRYLRADPRAHLCMLTERFFGSWIYVDGTAQIVSLPEAMEPLVDYYRRFGGEEPDWDEYRRRMERERRVLVRISLTRAGPDRTG
jgi:PPOX class probable F420-dependent enzyme